MFYIANKFFYDQQINEQILLSNFDFQLIFSNIQDEILHHEQDAELGCTKAQHRLGVLLIHDKRNTENLFKAYKWLFISVALGNEKARNDLQKVNNLLGGDEEIDVGFNLVMEWFGEKFDSNKSKDEEKWKPELLKYRFSAAALH